MNRKDLIQSAAAKSAMPQTEIEKALNAIIESITESMQKEEPVTLVGFGTFLAKERAARKGHNPSTGGAMEIPARKVVKFKAGSGLNFK